MFLETTVRSNAVMIMYKRAVPGAVTRYGKAMTTCSTQANIL